ncbi:hypothetical protein [Falsigemmobacter faecalis]|uniref:DUF2244 domain-containing protein n=1 Tax=Falsigemmobacter faecalis TaxID=2488730 RepID=A0A3P3DQ96_9RHOB|nr:hypothetical protein [Falsigemmobacter faecalis]RRH76433.1 hypothetical protein EG244_06675 [Falsigemmobacter faecalis]
MAQNRDDLIFRLEPGPVRRAIGPGLLLLTSLAFGVAVFTLPEAGLLTRAGVVALAVYGGFQAVQLRRAAKGAIELREDGLHCTGTGRHLVSLDEIDRVEAGLSLLKPASGFLIRLRARQPAARQPGMWWIRGNRLAIGGITPKGGGKAMASALSELLRLSRS